MQVNHYPNVALELLEMKQELVRPESYPKVFSSPPIAYHYYMEDYPRFEEDHRLLRHIIRGIAQILDKSRDTAISQEELNQWAFAFEKETNVYLEMTRQFTTHLFKECFRDFRDLYHKKLQASLNQAKQIAIAYKCNRQLTQHRCSAHLPCQPLEKKANDPFLENTASGKMKASL
ncbi:MAG: hypothetical protein K0S07_510 [Chlamydiales bacterium]|jgi:hypothetical protein|nr:hypothetical protein [Chlamydiales bacterium]